MTVVTTHPTILLFGGYTEPWLESIDRIHEQAGACAWLRLFLNDVASVIRAETRCMHPKIRNSLGPSGIFSSVQEVADLYRDHDDDVGFVQCIMSYIVRAVILLRWVHDSPDALKVSPRPEGLGISGGLINAAVLAISDDFESLRQASVMTAGFVCRLCEVAGQVLRAVEEDSSSGGDDKSSSSPSWGCAVVGVTPEKLDGILHQIQESKNIPGLKRARVGIRGDHWGTVIGPPSVLDVCLEHAAMGDLAKQRLPIYSMQHNYELSQSHREYIAGRSALHSRPVHPGFRLWGLQGDEDDADVLLNPNYADWGQLLLSVVDYAFSKPVDLVRMVKRLNARLGADAHPHQGQAAAELTLLAMGPTWFAGSLISKLKATGRRVSVVQHTVLGNVGHRHNPRPAEAAESYEGRIAVVGMAGRAPECDDLEQYWQVIETGRDVAREIPPGRFDADDLFQPQPGHGENSSCSRATCVSTCKLGCFLDNPGHYDARFFRVSPREALLMDPGSRLFQMACHEALESAGYSCGTTRAVDPSRISVLFGQSNVDGYETAHHEKGCDAYTLQALARPFAGGRVAFHYGWEGATYSVDQACSTSLSLIHLACRDLLAGDHDMVVAGAANVLASPHGWCLLSKAGVLSDTGNCRTFRDDAQGYCRGEFVGVVVLKRLADAVADNDRVLAVIPGSARNQAGNSAFLAQSDAGAEERVLRQALRRARLGPRDIAYAEMHGTATPVGDPCEMTAVANVLGRRPPHAVGEDVTIEDAEPLTVGSVKANIGHSEASSGVASVIKAILMFQKQVLPPQVGMPHALNKQFPPLHDKKIRILSKAAPFRSASGKPRRVLINNFDAAGGNTALVLEDFQLENKNKNKNKNNLEVPDDDHSAPESDPRPAHVVVLSAHTAASHQANKSRLAKWLATNPTVRLEDVAYTTTARRVHQPSFRFACAASSSDELVRALESDSKKPTTTKKSPVIFVFTGQGSHYAGMGGELYRTSPIFRDTVDLCQQICHGFGFPSFLGIITGSRSGSGSDSEGGAASGAWNTAQTQLAVLSLEIGLATFWQRLGVKPALVMGHSLGEYAALHVAGVLSLADALYLVGSRAELAMQKCNRRTPEGACAMLAVAAPAAAVRDVLRTLGLGPDDGQCSVACINSPGASVVSGTVVAVARLQAALMKQKTRSKVLPLPFGFHSFQVDAILDEFVALASGPGITYSWPPRVPVASTVLASVVEDDADFKFGPEYLAKQARNPVDFVGALHAVRARFQDSNPPVWLEIGPSQVCGAFVQETLSPPAGHVLSTLAGVNTSAWAAISECLAALYIHGCDPDWMLLHAPFERILRLLTLPSYAWDTKDFWIPYRERKLLPGGSAGDDGAGTGSTPGHLGRHQPIISTCAQYIVDKTKEKDGKTRVTVGASVTLPGFLAMIEGHRMQGVGLCPGSVFAEAAFVAAKCALEHCSGRKMDDSLKRFSLRSAHLRRPLTASLAGPEGELHVTAVVESESLVQVSFKALSRSSSSSSTSSSSSSSAAAAAAAPRSFDLGCCVVVVGNANLSDSDSDSDSFYIRARMLEVRRSCSSRLPASIFYALFSRAVQYASDNYRCVREVFVSDDFAEAVAEVVPVRDPAGVRFVAGSPYCGEALAHLAGFLVNCHPSRYFSESAQTPTTTTTTTGTSFIMDSLERFEQTADIEPGRSYFTYARVAERKADSAVCEVVVFDDADRLVMRTRRMRFHEVPNSVLQNLLPGGGGGGGGSRQDQSSLNSGGGKLKVQTSPARASPRAAASDEAATETKTELGIETRAKQPPAVFSVENQDALESDDCQQQPPGQVKSGLLPVILESIAEETGLDTAELTDDDAALADLGVDSIMAVEVCARVKEKSGYSLSPLFMLEHPTIGHLVRSFGAPQQPEQPEGRPKLEQEQDITVSPSADNIGASMTFEDTSVAERTPESSSSSSSSVVDDAAANDEPPPKARITLLQGRPQAGKGRLYMSCDGSGTIATYIHLLRRQFPLPVYGIDSPFLRCPSRLTTQVGIPGIARLMVEALVESHPNAGLTEAEEDSIVLGGFSGGSLISYEICRQLCAQGRRVAGLVVLDMRCPLSPSPPSSSPTTITTAASTAAGAGAGPATSSDEATWPIFFTTSADTIIGHNPVSVTHLRGMFACVLDYQPPRLAAAGPALLIPAAVVWCTRGMVGRLRRRRPDLVAKLVDMGYPAESYPGYMEDPRLGAMAWSLPDKSTETDLGPCGWEKYVGAGEDGEVGKNLLCLAVDGDHHDAIQPVVAPRFAECLDQGLRFVLGRKS
ncbi:Non-reducing polyketide synthase cla3 [Colletotrichum higginsianum]|uniref:Non-reducing polyketide synthase cla3 n=2 Tax=Colletotrichum higginsianum TaxID=80884 RepID=A0A4T0W4M6_9PEZI|nr:Non-reducing polyketide synthase cla3 [Colletotrichum higginsianum]